MRNSAIKSLLAAFYIYIFLEGVLRKWIFPSIPGFLFYAIKYLILILISLSYIIKRHKGLRNINTNIGKIYLFYAVTVIISSICITFLQNGFIAGSITTIQYITPIILIYTIPLCINDTNSLIKIIKWGKAIAFIVFLLAIIQYSSPPDSRINKYATEMENGIAMVGDAARVCSVFSYMTPLGDFCILIIAFTISIIPLQNKGVRNNLIYITLFLLGIIVSFMTGSRTVVLISALVILFFISKECIYNHNTKFITLILSLTLIFVTFYSFFGIEAIDNFIYRASESSNDVSTRINRTFDISRMFNYAGAFGNGVGIANMSVQSFITHPSEIDWEEEIGRVMIEFGLIGFIIITFVRIYVLINMVQISRSIKSHYISALSWATTIIIVPMTFYVQLCLYNWFAYIIYFTMLGLNIALKQIDKNEDCNIFKEKAFRC